ncbi:MAG: hypothetical protein RJQ04_03195 [Longimicrobiales bacterium]
MTSEILGLWVGLAGIVSSTVVGGLSVYFSAKARTAPHREHLYAQQVDLAVEVIGLVGRVRNFSAILMSGETSMFHVRAQEDLTETIADLSKASSVSAAILPVELYVQVSSLSTLVAGFAARHDAGEDVSTFPDQLAGTSAKLALMLRTFLGVEELSEEGARLLAVQGDLAGLAGLDPEDIVRASRAGAGGRDGGGEQAGDALQNVRT